MGRELLCLCRVEARRLIWLIGMMFAVILVFQYCEFPYGNLLSSLFSAGKASVGGNSSFQNGDSPSQSVSIGNMTNLIDSNSHSTYSVHERANTSNGRDSIPKDASLSGKNGGSNHSLGLDKDSSPENLVKLNNISSENNGSAAEEAREPEQRFYQTNYTTDSDFSIHKIEKDYNTSTSEHIESSDAGFASPSPAVPPMNSSPHVASPPLSGKGKNSSLNRVPKVNKGLELPTSSVVSISEMGDLLLQSRASSHSATPQWSSVVDQELLNARLLIENAPIINNDPNLYAPIYRNVSMFKRSYELMEDNLKVYIYREGEKPILHQPRLNGIYASEGWFMKLLEANKKFITRDPRKAHLFYLPFSSLMLEETFYVPNSHSFDKFIQFLRNYLDMISAKYSSWNRTGGADHFLVACHDWAPAETNRIMAKCIRALCNADVKEGFVLGKDVSLPETYVRLARNPLRDLGGKPPSQRSILAFFAGRMHGLALQRIRELPGVRLVIFQGR
ncbi:probable glycosyltransferase At5g03795 [Corylus avellana]|uniref:probable glycosyltransferase At5g03795 n=1 Tax=Corylus avellana TaxID=13451 RepID=UPI00286C449D|nr:probable glycosyltransferase At5g03795 [Corylus avellana]